MNKLLLSLAATAVLVLMSACNQSDEDHYTAEQNIPGNFTYIVNTDDNSTGFNQNVTVNLQLDYTASTTIIKISSLKMPDGTSYPEMTLKDVETVIDDENWLIMKASSITPNENSYGPKVTVTGLELRLYQRYFMGYYEPALSFRFTIDGKYDVYLSRTDIRLAGTTVTSSKLGSYTSKQTFYQYVFNFDKQTVDINLFRAVFMDGMPALNFSLKDVPFTFSGTTARISEESIIPLIGTTPNEAFALKNFVSRIDFQSGAATEFECSPESKVPGVTFSVSARCLYTDIVELPEDV